MARLALDGLAGAINLLRPADGLTDVSRPEGALASARLLGIGLPGFTSGDAASLIEFHQRGRNLAAAYRESAVWPARLDVLWCALAEPDALEAIEMVLSVRTYTHECRPRLTVRSLVKAEEVLAVAADKRCGPLASAAEGWTAVGGPAPCCLVFRLAGVPLSYAQMVHPSAFERDELLREADPVVPVQFRHHLFQPVLEKGVILRARIRAFFLPRHDDLQRARAAAEAFAASEPPLD